VEVAGILLPGPDDALIAAAVGAKGGYRVIRGIVEGSKGSTREIVVVLSKEGKVLSRTELEALRKCGAPASAVRQTLGRSPSSRILGENLEAVGTARPPNSAAHHIVAGGDDRAALARSILQREGIDINEAANGVFLSRSSSVVCPPAATHSGIHTRRYYDEVNRRLRNAAPGTVRQELGRIAQELLKGTFPY
jgi:hypothetical protein